MIENQDFERYLKTLYEHLCCNMTEEQHEKEYFVCYDYTEEQINLNIDYFKNCQEQGLSPYKALLFFYENCFKKAQGFSRGMN